MKVSLNEIQAAKAGITIEEYKELRLNHLRKIVSTLREETTEEEKEKTFLHMKSDFELHDQEIEIDKGDLLSNDPKYESFSTKEEMLDELRRVAKNKEFVTLDDSLLKDSLALTKMLDLNHRKSISSSPVGGKARVSNERVYLKRSYADDSMLEIPSDSVVKMYNALQLEKSSATATEIEW